LQRQIDALQEGLKQQNKDKETPIATAVAVAVEVVEDDRYESKKLDTSKPTPSAPQLQPYVDGDGDGDCDCWNYVDAGDIRVGPGSYYTDDDQKTVINESITKESDAKEFISTYERSDNPIAMWQIVYEEGVPRLWAHRFAFMHQNLDADTGGSPKGFATSTKKFLSHKRNWGKRGRIYVRSDQWWKTCKDGTKPSPVGWQNSLIVKGNTHPDCELEEGRFCILSVQAITDILGHDAWIKRDSDINFKSFVASSGVGGHGTVFRARNERTDKELGLLVWSNGVDAYGCCNPTEFTTSSDWKVGDVINLLDFPCQGKLANVSTYSSITGTGWNLGGDNIRFGQCGLVGGWWKEMEIEYELRDKSSISGVWSDSVELPYTVKYQNEHGDWIVLKTDCKGSFFDATFSKVQAKRWRLHWESTDMHKTQGLSTYRSGGGLHAELIA